MNTEKKGQDTTPKNKTSFAAIYILGFIVSLLFEFYWITYFPYDYFMLFGIGLILCILGYLSIDAILEIIHDINKKKAEQNELLIKASKAIYLATKKNSANADKKQLQNLKALDAIINRAVENIQVPRTSSANPEELQQLVSELSKTNEQLSRELENVQALQLTAQTLPIPETPVEDNFVSDIPVDNDITVTPLEDNSIADILDDNDITVNPLENNFDTNTTSDNDITITPLQDVFDDVTPVSEEQVNTMITEDVQQAEVLVSNTMQEDFAVDIAEDFSETVETTENDIEISEIMDIPVENIDIPQMMDIPIENIEIPMETIDSPIENSDLSETAETIPEVPIEINEVAQTVDIPADTVDIAPEVTATMDTVNMASEVPELDLAASDTIAAEPIEPSDNPNRTMTAEEIAALFANL